MIRSHLLRSSGSKDPVTHIANANNQTDGQDLSVSGSFEAGDVVLFTVSVSLENTSKSLVVGSTATVDGSSATLLFADSKTGLTDDRYLQTFRYTLPSSASSLSLAWTGLTASEITTAGADIQMAKGSVVVRNAKPVPYATNNFVIEADATKTISEKKNGYLYRVRTSFKDDGRGDSWGVTEPSGASTLMAYFSNEIIIGNYWTDRTTGTATFEYTEPTSEPHWLIGHIVALQPA